MSITLDDSAKQQVLLAAATLAGPTATQNDINSQIDRLIGVVAPDGAAAKHLDYRIDHYKKTVDKMKTIIGVIVNVDREIASNRGVVFLHSAENGSRYYQPFEAVRTDITKDNETAAALAKQAVSLIGHKIAATVRVEIGRNEQKVRVLESIEDRGIWTDDEIPEFDMDIWDATKNSSPKSEKLQRGSKGLVFPIPAAE